MKIKALPFFASLSAALLAANIARGYTYITNDSTGLPFRWPPGVVTIQIKLGSATTLTDGTNFSTSAQAAAQTWNPQLGDLQITSQIVPVTAATDHNRVNELVFASDVFGQAFDTNVLAVTTTWVRGNERTEGDIIFNSARTWDSYRGALRSGIVDLQRVALHEMGHLLGLNHPDEAAQSFNPPLPIMNSRITSNDTLTADDITGVQNLYGPPGTPGNDNFANATNLTLTNNLATATGYTTNATKQAGEPNHAGNAGGHSIWWKWTAPTAGSLAVDTRGSYADTTLGVYTGNAVASLNTIASNDDINPGIVQASSLTFTATGGTTYFFGIDGFDGDSAAITLNLTFTPASGTLPTITTQPVSVTTTSGTSVVFGVVASAGTSTVTYQWQFNGTAIASANSSSLNLVASATTAGSYSVVVTSTAGSVSSDTATLTVNAAPVTPAPAPTPAPSGGGGGGGGAPSPWFLGALSLLALTRFLRRSR